MAPAAPNAKAACADWLAEDGERDVVLEDFARRGLRKCRGRGPIGLSAPNNAQAIADSCGVFLRYIRHSGKCVFHASRDAQK